MPFRFSTRLSNYLYSQRPQPPVFPTLQELLGSETTATPAAKQERLFSALLGDPHLLWQDLLRSPTRYEDGVAELVQRLISASATISTLSERELALLDRATLDFNYAGTRADSEKRAEAAVTVRRVLELESDEEDDRDEDSEKDAAEEAEEEDLEGIPLENFGPHLLQMGPDNPATENIKTDASNPDSYQLYWWQQPSKLPSQ